MRESSPDDSLLPPPKRRRFGGAAHPSPTPFWFSDGDIVLQVEQHRFRVHGARLRCSEIFSDMLAMPQPPDAETVDGCPLVHLADAAQDWQVALKWMYDPAYVARLFRRGRAHHPRGHQCTGCYATPRPVLSRRECAAYSDEVRDSSSP